MQNYWDMLPDNMTFRWPDIDWRGITQEATPVIGEVGLWILMAVVGLTILAFGAVSFFNDILWVYESVLRVKDSFYALQ